MNITNRNDIFSADARKMLLRPMPSCNESDIELIARRIRSKKFELRQQKRRSAYYRG